MLSVEQIIWDFLTLPCPKTQRHITEELNHDKATAVIASDVA